MFPFGRNPTTPAIQWRPMERDGADGTLYYLRIAGPNDMNMAQKNDLGNATFWRDLRIEP